MFRSMLIVDAEGQRLASSREDIQRGPSVAHLDFFNAAREGRVPTLYVGTPFVGHLDGRESIGVSMDWRDRPGNFRGVVVLVADADFLDGHFEQIAPQPDVTMALYRHDHALVSDGPGDGTARLLPAQAAGPAVGRSFAREAAPGHLAGRASAAGGAAQTAAVSADGGGLA